MRHLWDVLPELPSRSLSHRHKSCDQTWLGLVAKLRQHEQNVSHNPPSFAGAVWGLVTRACASSVDVDAPEETTERNSWNDHCIASSRYDRRVR